MSKTENMVVEEADESFIEVALRAYSTNTLPSAVSEFLGVEPTTSFVAGSTRYGAKGESRGVYSKNGWLYEKTYSSDLPFEEIIGLFISEIGISQNDILKIQNDGFAVDIYVGYFGLSNGSGFAISAECISLLSELGIKISFSFYW